VECSECSKTEISLLAYYSSPVTLLCIEVNTVYQLTYVFLVAGIHTHVSIQPSVLNLNEQKIIFKLSSEASYSELLKLKHH